MPLPDCIEIEPLTGPITATITVPGSKSITNRALVLAALGQGSVHLEGALWSEDTQIMVDALGRLGFSVEAQPDPNEPGNRTIRVEGINGAIPRSGTRERPLELWVGNAGTAARFLAALVCLGKGWYRLDGVARMRERPQGALFAALRELGYTVEAPNDRLPATICGAGPRAGQCRVSIIESSQFASALFLCAGLGQWTVEVAGENAEESAYVVMTRELLRVFPAQGGVFRVEPDASGGSYFWAAAWLGGNGDPPIAPVRAWPETNWQIDAQFPKFLPLRHRISRQTDLGDSIMTAIVLAPFAQRPIEFVDLGRLRLQECDRVSALRTELARCGARVEEVHDRLTVFPSRLQGAEIRTYNDHRMAMCFAILGLKVPGIRIQNPACVKKTFPNFFQKLSAPPPHGLGAQIRAANTSAVLSVESLGSD